jgi:hypothetical protein
LSEEGIAGQPAFIRLGSDSTSLLESNQLPKTARLHTGLRHTRPAVLCTDATKWMALTFLRVPRLRSLGVGYTTDLLNRQNDLFSNDPLQ